VMVIVEWGMLCLVLCPRTYVASCPTRKQES
jgi:hypothetical protein